MKTTTTIFYLSLFPCSLILSATQPQFTNNINVYASSSQVAHSSTTMTSIKEALPSALLKELAHGSGSFMSNHKALIAGLAASYTYGRTLFSVLKANHTLAHNGTWARWKSDFSLDELTSQDQEMLTKELLREIQKRHTNAEKPADALLPFIGFLQAVDGEIASLNNYRSLYYWLASCHATWLFPFDKQRFASIQGQLERLWFIKNLFLNWSAEYKLSTLVAHSTNGTLTQLKRYTQSPLSAEKNNLFSCQKTSGKAVARTLLETAFFAQAAALVGAAITCTPVLKSMKTRIDITL